MNQKWNLQDIRPAEPRTKRTLGTMPPPSPTKPVAETAPREPQLEREHIPSIVIEDGTKKGNNRVLFSVIAFVALVGGALGLSMILGKTELTVYPVFKEPNINSEFTAYPDRRPDALSYEIMTIESTAESQVKASGQVDVEVKTSGLIQIVKTTPGAERIIANTRFRSPDGKIYRIKDAIVVPGAVNDVPGTIQAEVTADEPGDMYNKDTGTRFDVPGFEESGLTDLYKAVYAENKAPLTGGYKGPQYKIDDAELSTARQALQIKLRDELLAKIEAEKPNGFIALPGAVAITYDQQPTVPYGNDLVTIKERATLQIPIFKNSDLGTFLAKAAVATYNGGSVRIDDPKALTFEYKTASTSNSVIANEPSLTFNLKGKPKLIWEFDQEALKKDLAGLPKTAISNIISSGGNDPKYPGIQGANISITPFWKQSFPSDPNEITVVEELKVAE
jgi:hypothetical protein